MLLDPPTEERALYRPIPTEKADCISPVELLVVACGGDMARAAGLAGVTVKTLYTWRRPSDKGGRDGLIPDYRIDPILRRALLQGVPIERAELEG